ncbi:hypothetical protein I4U23_015585 [Adineta vaga]|nr:hypothetical protein I4U23_015585 [Adineta vaga]
MFSSFSKIIFQSQLSRSLIKQQSPFASSKTNSSSRSTSKPIADPSDKAGPHTQKERSEWEKKEQGFTSDTETRQERIPPNEKKTNNKIKSSKK